MLLYTIRSSGHHLRWDAYLRSSPQLMRSQYLLRTIASKQNLSQVTRALRQSRSLSTKSTANGDSTNSSTATSSLNIKQRKSGTWMPKWQVLTLSSDNLSDPSKFKASVDQHPHRDEPAEEADASKHLLSPQTALAVFLPKGFPDSVTPNYWPFAKWQFVHNIAGSVTAVISTQSLLFAMGLGAGSIPMAAALNWIIKDGLGQLGGVVYASFVSDKFDSEPKRFRFQATVAMQGANLLELLTPLWPGYFLVIASISNIGKNMAWLASSATRAQMNKTFALRDNLGDITGKSGSQTTAAGLVGTGLGVVIAALMSFISEDPTALPLVPMCLTFLPFSIFNIYSNYRSSHYVTTPSLNVPRAETVFHHVLKKLAQDMKGSNKEKPTHAHLQQQLELLVPTPIEVAHAEVFVMPYISPFDIAIDIEPSITRFTGQGEGTEALSLAFKQKEFVQGERYYIMADESVIGGRGTGLCNGKIVIWFDKKARGLDLIRGFYHACAARMILEKSKSDRRKFPGEGESETEIEWRKAINTAHEQTIETVPMLVEVMNKKGWDTTSLFLTDGDRNRVQLE
ncbi:hypothetical protein BGX27_001361 [Mortierella sp. AM989]|nr:hypothetical protein BGX27_001361 [Mortierella sp. AM989]